MLTVLLTTYTIFENVDVYGTPPRRPASPDTEVTEEQPEKPVDQDSTNWTAIDAAIGAFIGVLVVAAILGIKHIFKFPGSPDDCCIASSVTGTGMIAPVNFLRSYRERVVKKSARGQRSVNITEKIYYSISPPIAKLDAKYEKFRLVTRTFWSGPIVSLLLCGMLLFNSGRKEFTRLQKTDSKLTLKILTMGISSSIFAISWIIWNCYLIISLFNSGILADIWQPAAGMLIGIVSLLILRTLYSDIPTLSDSSRH